MTKGIHHDKVIKGLLPEGAAKKRTLRFVRTECRVSRNSCKLSFAKDSRRGVIFIMSNTHAGGSRDAWRSKWGFILACIGSAVGMGNIWLFPSRVATYGGAFLVAYLFFDILIGFSGVIGEMCFGRAARTGPVGAFEQACATRGHKRLGTGLGLLPMLGALSMAIGYSVVVSWIFKYLFGALTGSTVFSGADATVLADYEQVFSQTASAFGNNLWLLVALLVTFVIMALGIGGGIEQANKIMIPLFYVLFIGLAIYVGCQEGAANGYRWMFTVDPTVLKNPEVWVYALGQSFFSLSLAGNGTIIYGSYLSDKQDIVSSAWKVALFDTLAAMLAALVIVPAMAAAGQTAFSGGPGLMFIYLPNLFSAMPGGRAVMFVFFVAALLAGLTSLVNLFEAPVATLQDHLHFGRAGAVGVIAVIGTLVALCIQGIVSDWMDFVSIYVCPLGAGLAGILFAWVWGREKVESAVSLGRRRPVGRWYYPLYKYVFCGLTIAVLLLGIAYGGIG